jgi:putative oxidoreductase
MNATEATISQSPAAPTRVQIDYLGTAARWVLGLVFIYMGWNKAIHPEAFLKLIRQYDLTNSSLLLNTIAAGLPWFEIFCGVLLVIGVGARGTALLLLMMLVPFTAVVCRRALMIADLQHIALCAVRFDCGCGSGEVLICRKLVENGLLMLLSGLVLAGFGKRFAARYGLFDGGDKSDQAKLRSQKLPG